MLGAGRSPGEGEFGPFLACAVITPTLPPGLSARLEAKRQQDAKGAGCPPPQSPACLFWPGKVFNPFGDVCEGVRGDGRQGARPISLNVFSEEEMAWKNGKDRSSTLLFTIA